MFGRRKREAEDERAREIAVLRIRITEANEMHSRHCEDLQTQINALWKALNGKENRKEPRRR